MRTRTLVAWLGLVVNVVALPALSGCEPINGGLLEVYWQLASPDRRVITCDQADVATVELALEPVRMGEPARFRFDCLTPRAETGFVIAPGEYRAVLIAYSRSGQEVKGCSLPVFINVDHGQPSSLRVVEIQLGLLDCVGLT